MLTLLAAFSHTSVIIHSSYTYHHTFIIYSSYVRHTPISYMSKIAFLPPNASPSSPSLLHSSLPLSLHQRSHLWPLLSSSKPFSVPIFLGSHMLIYFCLPLALEPSEGKSSASLARTFTRAACGRR